MPAYLNFLQLRWLQRKWTPTEVFLRLARPNVFCIWRKRCKDKRRPKCFRALRDRMFSDWRSRSVSARRLQFFCDWGDRSTSYRRRKCFRAWRDRKFLSMARPNQKCPPTAVLLRLRWTKPELPPPEVFSRLAQKTLFAFRDWHDWSKSHCRPKFYQTKASDVLVTNDRFFCVCRDWKFLRLARPKYKCQPTEVLFWLVQKERKWPLTKSFLATRANEAKITNDRNFCAWPDRTFLWLVRPKQNSSRTAVFCNWGDRSTSDRRPKSFLRLARQKVFQLAWPKHNFTPREVYLQLARP